MLLPTSLAQQYHSCCMDSYIPELHCHSHTVFFLCTNTIVSGEIPCTPTQFHTIVTYDNADLGEKTRFN